LTAVAALQVMAKTSKLATSTREKFLIEMATTNWLSAAVQ